MKKYLFLIVLLLGLASSQAQTVPATGSAIYREWAVNDKGEYVVCSWDLVKTNSLQRTSEEERKCGTFAYMLPPHKAIIHVDIRHYVDRRHAFYLYVFWK